MASVGSRPEADGELIENSILWAAALPSKPDLQPQQRLGWRWRHCRAISPAAGVGEFAERPRGAGRLDRRMRPDGFCAAPL